MEVPNFFINKQGQLRSGWRVLFFAIAFMICAKLFAVAASFITSAAFGPQPVRGNWEFVIGAVVLLSSATLVGWCCGAIFEELPFSFVGWWPHRGWLKNVLVGTVIGTASLLLAAGCTAITRGMKFSCTSSGATSIGKTVVVSAIIFVWRVQARSAVPRLSASDTYARKARLGWSAPHIGSVCDGPSKQSTRVALFHVCKYCRCGCLAAAAYLRTRSLWFPLGLHWSWNWTQASLLGLPVSGIDRIAPAPLLHAMNAGPDWLTGGAYGIEGGAACTVALIVSTLVVWRTKLVSKCASDRNVTT